MYSLQAAQQAVGPPVEAPLQASGPLGIRGRGGRREFGMASWLDSISEDDEGEQGAAGPPPGLQRKGRNTRPSKCTRLEKWRHAGFDSLGNGSRRR